MTARHPGAPIARDDVRTARMTLANLPLMQFASRRTVQVLLDHAQLLDLSTRHLLLEENAPVDAVFFLLRGTARFFHAHPTGEFSPQVLLAPCHFGHVELLTGTTHAMQSVQIVDDAWVARVPWTCARSLLALDHAFALAWLEDLALQFRHTAETVKQVALGDLTARIANVLLSYSDNAARALTLNHRQIAQHVASPRRSVIRAMQRLYREGILATVQGKLVVLDPARLEEKLKDRRFGLAHRGRMPTILVQ